MASSKLRAFAFATVFLGIAATSLDAPSDSNTSAPIVVTNTAALEVLRGFAPFAAHLGQGTTLHSEGDRFHATLPHAGLAQIDPSLPTTADGAVHLGLPGEDGFWIELRDPDVASVSGVASEGALVFAAAAHDTDVVWVVEAGRAEEIRLLRSPASPTHVRESVTLGPRVSSVRLREGRLELLDDGGRVRLSSEPMFAVDAKGVRREVSLRFDEKTKLLESDLDTTGLTHPIALDPVWSPAASMAAQRTGHTASPLPSGKVLIAGGSPNTAGDPISTAEIYDPATNTWALTPAMTSLRNGHVAVALASGKVLIATGRKTATLVTNTAEIFDPTAGSFNTTGSLIEGRFGSAATLLSSGKVLVAGGAADGTTILSSVELYDPSSGTWSAAAPLAAKRTFHTATTLGSGKVLVAGGFEPISNAEIYDPGTNTWSSAPFMSKARGGHTATLLPSGKVLVVGGGTPSTGSAINGAELYDPLTNTWSAAGLPLNARIFHTATLLGSGKVLVAGGASFGSPLSTSELYDPATNTWTSVSATVSARSNHAGAPIAGGALISGGKGTGSVVLSSAEVYAPAPVGTACSAPGECASGNCVDGRCCESACTGQCESCNAAAGPAGKCVPIAGTPIGTRLRCDTTNPDVCKRTTCDGKDGKTCAGFAVGTACGGATCTADGLSRTGGSTCDGKGTCGTPSGTPVSCAPYKCSGGICRTSCSIDADCQTGKCTGGRCDSNGCASDGWTLVNKDGSTTSCYPFRCRSGACTTTCISNNDCASLACDTVNTHLCYAPQPADSGCGCEVGRDLGTELAPAALLGALAFIVRRRRRA